MAWKLGSGAEIHAFAACGHLHRFIHQDATVQTPFPIIVNSNTAVLKATADPKELKIEVVDVDGKVLDQFSIKKP